MRIVIATPSLVEPTGNARTAKRWCAHLDALGHDVTVTDEEVPEFEGDELLVAIHAVRRADAVTAFRTRYPSRPVVVLLSGTDLYADPVNARMTATLGAADRIIVLHPNADDDIDSALRDKIRWIPQSVIPPEPLPSRPEEHFRVIVVANLRAVKDPLRTMEAVRDLPAASRIRVDHYGLDLDPELLERARNEPRDRYRFHGALSPTACLREIAASHVLSLTSRLEGGANVVSEALAVGTPVVASRVAGNVGLLGPDHPGYFPCGDTAALRQLLLDLENDAAAYERLRRSGEAKRALFTPERERAEWAKLLAELESTDC